MPVRIQIYKLTLFISIISSILSKSIKYLPFNDEIFKLYGNNWLRKHSSWLLEYDADNAVHFNQLDALCNDIILPTCIHNRTIDLFNGKIEACPSLQCLDYSKTLCHPTPSEIIDLIPLPYNADNATVNSCLKDNIVNVKADNLFYNMDQGISPDYLPLSVTPLVIKGNVYVQSADYSQCKAVSDAVIDLWQIDASKLDKLSIFSTATFTANKQLRDYSCRSQFSVNEDGSYEIITSIPPSFGPPRHIIMSVSSPTYPVLNTFMYFDLDLRLYHLTHKDKFVDSKLLKGSIVAKDPRVAKLRWISTLNSSQFTVGHFETEFNINLLPSFQQLPSGSLQSSEYPININGLWFDESSGGSVLISTRGNSFYAVEYPHARVWGSVHGVIVGNAIRGAVFGSKTNYDAIFDQSSVGFDLLSTTQSSGSFAGTVVPADPVTFGERTSVAGPNDVIILWYTSNSEIPQITWSKVPFSQISIDSSREVLPVDAEYRYLKLVILKETGGYANGQMVINEIEFLTGILSQTAYPVFKMISPRSYQQVVTCSSFSNQDNHCYKAFDGNLNASSSAWITKGVGSSSHELAVPQYVIFDFGKERGILPTGLRIICDAGNPLHPLGCPMTFILYGSNNLKDFKALYSIDMPHYNNEYSVIQSSSSHSTTDSVSYKELGQIFLFVYESSYGYVNGNVCGSCLLGPFFQCNVDSYDNTCASTYCNRVGICGNPFTSIVCENSYKFDNITLKCVLDVVKADNEIYTDSLVPAGFYRAFSSNSNESEVVYDTLLCEKGHYCIDGAMHKCSAGRYGESQGLSGSDCTGPCISGEYCDIATIFPVRCPKGKLYNKVLRKSCEYTVHRILLS